MKNIFKSKNFKPLKNMCPQGFSADILDMLDKYLDKDFELWEFERRAQARRRYNNTLKLDPYRLKILLFYESVMFRMKYKPKIYNILINERKKDMAKKRLRAHEPDSLTAKQQKQHPVKKIDVQSRIDEVQENIEINHSINDFYENIQSETEEQYIIKANSTTTHDDNDGYIQKNISSSKHQKEKTESNKSYMTIISWIYYTILVAIIFNFIIRSGIKSIFNVKLLSLITIVFLIPDVILPFIYNHMLVPTYLSITNFVSK